MFFHLKEAPFAFPIKDVQFQCAPSVPFHCDIQKGVIANAPTLLEMLPLSDTKLQMPFRSGR